MPDNQADINIGVKYDGAGAAAAIADIEKLPKSVRNLAEDLNRSGFAADEMARALQRANTSLQAHIDSLDPDSAQYAKAAAQAQSFASRQQALSSRVETARGFVQKQAAALQSLSDAYQRGKITSDQFAQEVDKIGEKSIQAERSCERLNAQLRALQANQQKQAAQNALIKAPAALPARAVSSWTGLFNYIKRGAAGGAGSIASMVRAAGGLMRISAWGAVAKAVFDGMSKAVGNIGKSLGIVEDKNLTLTNVVKGLFSFASEGASRLFTGIGTSLVKTDNWLGQIVKKSHDWLGTVARVATIDKEVAEAKEREAQTRERVLKQMSQEYELARKSLVDAQPDSYKKAIDEQVSGYQKIFAERKKEQEQASRAADAEMQKQQQLARQALDAATREAQLAAARGDKTREQADAEIAEAKRVYEVRVANLRQETALRQASLQQTLAQYAEAMSGEISYNILNNPDIRKWQQALQIQLPDEQALARLDAQLKNPNSKLTDQAKEELLAEKSRILAQVDEVRRAVADLVPGLKPTGAEAVTMLRKMQEINQAFEEQKGNAAQLDAETKREAEASRAKADLAVQQTQEVQQKADADREIAEAQAAAAKRAKGWERAQEGDLNEQERYVEKMLTAVKQSSDEWEKWAAASRKLANERAMQDLAQISELSQSLGGSADLLAQQKILATQRERLAELTRRTGLSAATMSAINKELAGVQRNSAAWRASMAKRAKEGQDNLLHAKAPDLPAKNKTMAGNLKQLNKAYEKDLRDLELAARKGDQEDIKHLIAHLLQNTRAREAITGNTGKLAEDLLERLKDAQALAKVGDGLTPEKRRKQHVEELLNGPLDPKKDPPRALPKEKPEQPRREKKPQQKPRREHPPPAPAAPAAPPIDIAPATQAAKQAAANTAQAAKQMSELAASISSIGSAAQELASATQNAISSTQTAIKAIERKINSILLKL